MEKFFLNRINSLIIINPINKKFTFILLFKLYYLLVTCQVSDSLIPVTLYYPDGSIASKGFLRQNKPDGYWINYFENGNKKSEGNRINFLLDGTWYFYDSLGNVTSKINYSSGLKHGTKISYDNGKIVDSCFYVNDVLQGYRVLYKDGIKNFLLHYKDGLENGESFEFDSSGTIITVLSYKDGVLLKKLHVNRRNTYGMPEGIYMDFYSNYKVKVEGYFKNGKRNGQFKYYSPYGEIIKIEIWVDDSLVDNSLKTKVNYIKKYFSNSFTVKQEGLFINDSIPVGRHTFYDEKGAYKLTKVYSDVGSLLSEGKLDSLGRKTGIWTFYYDDGTIFSKGEFKDDLKIGLWEYFYNNGSIREKGEYLRDLPNGKWLTFCENGQIIKEVHYNYGKEDGVCREYDCSGNLIKESYFEEGILNGPWYLSINNFIEKGQFINGVMVGKWITYYDNENIRTEISYENGLENGPYILYYPNGKKMINGYFVNGKREGIWSFFDQNGNKYLTIEYKNGIEKRYNGVKITL